MVKSGAILGVGSDYAENGRDAGLLVAEVIRGKDPSRIPFHATTKIRRSVNLDNARRLGVSIPAEWVKTADVVIPAPTRDAIEGRFMDCQIRRADDVAELVLVGSLDSSWSSYFSDRIDEVVRGGALEVRVDMAGVSYLSSNGIGLLIRYHRQLRKIGGRFRIVADSEAVSHVLRLTGVWQLLHDDGPSPEPPSGPAARCETIERDGMVLQVFPKRERRRGRATRADRRPRAASRPRVRRGRRADLEGGPGGCRLRPGRPGPELRSVPRAVRRVPGGRRRCGLPAERRAGAARLRASGRRVRSRGARALRAGVPGANGRRWSASRRRESPAAPPSP